MSTKSALSWLDKHYAPILTIILFTSVIIPLLNPIGIPISIGKEAIDFFDAIEELSEGDIVVLENQFAAIIWAELKGCGIAVMRHLFERNIKVIIFNGHSTENGILFLQLMEHVDKTGKTYGEDWVMTTYVPGGVEIVLARFLEDFYTVEYDWYNTPIEDVPLMQSVRNGYDIPIVISIGAGDYIEASVRQITPYTKLVAAVRGGNIAHAIPYYDSGQLAGLILSTRGAAEYELLIGAPGDSIKNLDAVNMSHLLAIAAIVVGNIPFLYSKMKRKV